MIENQISFLMSYQLKIQFRCQFSRCTLALYYCIEAAIKPLLFTKNLEKIAQSKETYLISIKGNTLIKGLL